MTKSTPVTLAILLLAACTGGERLDRSTLEPALNAITSEGMLGHIRTLASDAYEGRAPGTAGEDSAVAYLTAQFKSLGLAPGNPDGSYVQNVELVGYTGTSSATVRIGRENITMRPTQDFIAVSRHDTSETNVANTEIVFVGYGVVAPEYGWDDYRGVDVKGQNGPHHGGRPADPGSGRFHATRLHDVPRQGDDVLRALDLQVRNGQ
jgi:hypothetical protein